jgi:hypothetical protein
VEPTMSQKRAVTIFRSEPPAEVAGASGEAHSPQNLLVAGFS